MVGTRRFFIGKNIGKFIFNCDFLEDCENDDVCVIHLDFYAAWNYEEEHLSKICKKYNISMAIYGVESGMQFVRKSVVNSFGEITQSMFKQYEDTEKFMFEVPFSNLGG